MFWRFFGWTFASLLTAARARPYEKCPMFEATLDMPLLNKRWQFRLESKPQPHAIKYWTGSEVYFPKRENELENAVLTKAVLGPVAVLLNFALRRTARGIFGYPVTPPRRKAFLKALLEVSIRLVEAYNDFLKQQKKELITDLLGDDCVKALEIQKYEKIRQIYRKELINYREGKPDFEGGNPPFYASRRYYGWFKKDIKKWRLIDAINIGTMQVKCLVLRLFDEAERGKDEAEKVKERVKSKLYQFPPYFQAVLDARLGSPWRLFKPLSGLSGWMLECPPNKFFEFSHVPQVVNAVAKDVEVVNAVAKDVEEYAAEKMTRKAPAYEEVIDKNSFLLFLNAFNH